MTNAAMTQIRMIAETMNTTEQTMTARDAALSNGRYLGKNADVWVMADGSRYAWDARRELWVRY